MTIPVFGHTDDAPHRERPASYALLAGEKGIAVVRAADGALFLPGGGRRPGESPEDAVVRELMEECRMSVECVGAFASAVQRFLARRDGLRYRSSMTFVECRLLGVEEGEGEHELLWLAEDPGRGAFAHEAHHWAFGEFLAATRGPGERGPRG